MSAQGHDDEELRVGDHGPVRVLRLNRPHRLNAFDGHQTERLRTALLRAQADDAVQVVVLTGVGRAFCTGGDLKSGYESREAPAEHGTVAKAFATASLVTLMEWIGKPILAMVNGLTYAGGVALMLSCDISIAARSATFCVPEAARGLIDPYMPGRLGGRIGMERAKWLILTGQPIDADTALAWGLVSQVVDDADLEATTLEIARTMAESPGAALRDYKRIMRRTMPELDLGTYVSGIASEIADDGIRAFAQSGNRHEPSSSA